MNNELAHDLIEAFVNSLTPEQKQAWETITSHEQALAFLGSLTPDQHQQLDSYLDSWKAP